MTECVTESYLIGRTQSVRIGIHSSPVTPSPVGVPQGSVLGPLLFSIYTSPIFTIAQSQHVSQQQYADDTQLYLALSPANHSQSVSALQSCLNSLHIWFCENGMALNPNKSVAILFGTPQRLKSLSGLKSVNVAGTVIPLSNRVKILGATLDANLTMSPHISALSSSCFYHIRSFRQIRSSLDDSTAASVASALISSRLDQLNSILYGISLKHIARLQRIQRAAARVVLYRQSRTSPLSSNELLKQLHWLPIEWRIRFKLATLTFKTLHTGRPPYLTDLLQHHEPTRLLRSSSSHQLSVPRHNLTFGSRAFRCSSPRVWNSLPVSIRESQSLPTFRRHLKTFYFQSAYPSLAAHLA